MAKLFGLDIPSGLETLYADVLKILGLEDTNANVGRQLGYHKRKYSAFAQRSLFVFWQSLYDGFTSGRRSSWDVYWGTLPFGSHAGANSYPGSGYSAFVYVNAPRLKAGLDLLLDPPSVNLIYNGDFALGDAGWLLFDGADITANVLHLNGLPNPFNAPNAATDTDHLISFEEAATYRITCDFIVSPGGDLNLFRYSLVSEDIYFIGDIFEGTGTTSFDFTTNIGFGDNQIGLFSDNAPSLITVDNIVLVRIS